jgi:predicted GNAT family acetyltransferase
MAYAADSGSLPARWGTFCQASVVDALTFTDPEPFAARVGPVIERFPVLASVLATNLDQSLHGPGAPTQWFLIQDGAQALGAAMYSPPYDLILTPVSDSDPGPAMSALAEAVSGTGETLSGVLGPNSVAEQFVRIWCQQTGAQSQVVQSARMYELDTAPEASDVTGSVRPATEADLALASRWLSTYTAEAVPFQASSNTERAVRRRLARGRLLFWEVEGQPVSMAGVSRPIAAVARVGAVYTPRPHRGRGFGTAITVAASRQAFTDGAERCILSADLANPSSNRIYQAIGYRPVGDTTHYRFG